MTVQQIRITRFSRHMSIAEALGQPCKHHQDVQNSARVKPPVCISDHAWPWQRDMIKTIVHFHCLDMNSVSTP